MNDVAAKAVPRTLLSHHLAPLMDLLDRDDVEEVCVNIPGEAWVYTSSGGTRMEVPALDMQRLQAIAKMIANHHGLVFSEDFPKLSATLPNNDRLEIIFPPLLSTGRVALAIRRQRLRHFTLADLTRRGMFKGTRIVKRTRERPTDPSSEMEAAAEQNDIAALLRAAVLAKRTIVCAGPPGAGKTAVLNALCFEIPASERIITIEDVRELRTPQANAVNLKLSFSNQSVAKLGPHEVMESILRLRPDRVILGEVKGKEILVFFELVNTGSPGTMTSVHANSTFDAPWRLADLAHKHDTTQDKRDLRGHAEAYVDVFVQVKRDGERRVTEVAWI